MMATTQHAWALLTSAVHAQLAQSVIADTGDATEDGTPISVGGFVLIGSLDDWRFVVGIGLQQVFAAMLTQIQAVNAQSPTPVGLLLALVDDDNRQPDLTQLDAAMDAAQLTPVNWWLSSNGFDALASGASLKQAIEAVGGCFRDGFAVGQDMVM